MLFIIMLSESLWKPAFICRKFLIPRRGNVTDYNDQEGAVFPFADFSVVPKHPGGRVPFITIRQADTEQ
jgi:hypothetical protein